MIGAQLRSEGRDFQIGCDPLDIRHRRQESIKPASLMHVQAPIGLHQQFRHRYGRRDRARASMFEPGKDDFRKGKISSVCLGDR